MAASYFPSVLSDQDPRWLQRTLRALEVSLRDDPAPRKSQSGYRLPTSDQPKAYRTKLTDEQVLECRALHEFDGVSAAELVKRFDVSKVYMNRLLDYTVRSKLIPRKDSQ